LIDSGNGGEFARWIDDHPNLLCMAVDEDGSFAEAYFQSPRLIWFVAENPIRNGSLPANIGQVTETLIALATATDRTVSCSRDVTQRRL
jgi:peptide-methionine (S)-S-oxide reductase